MNTAEKLFNLARQAREHAYAPYSAFRVGVENVSYPCGTCAEAGAIAAMINGGDSLIAEILIIADSADIITPCGACLQRIKEFSRPETKIRLANLNGIAATYTVREMLPHAFNAEELKQ